MDENLLRFEVDKKIVFIDCETENLCLHNSHNVPWQIAMIKSVGGKKEAEKNFLVHYDRELNVSKEAAAITRFNSSEVSKSSVPFKNVFPTIKEWLDSADYIAGHNILGFDIHLIKGMYESHNEDYKHLMEKIIDTMCIAKGIKMGAKYKPDSESFIEYQYKVYHQKVEGIKTNLMTLGKEYSIDHNYEMLHDAINDLELNLKVWNKLKWMLDY